jgi:hypothetical protein
MAKLRWAFVASIAAVALVIASYTQSWYKVDIVPKDSSLGPKETVIQFYWKKSTTTRDGDKNVSFRKLLDLHSQELTYKGDSYTKAYQPNLVSTQKVFGIFCRNNLSNIFKTVRYH